MRQFTYRTYPDNIEAANLRDARGRELSVTSLNMRAQTASPAAAQHKTPYRDFIRPARLSGIDRLVSWACRKQPTRWSFTIPADCMNA